MTTTPTTPQPHRDPPEARQAAAALAACLGWQPPDARLALVALTHKSFANEHRGDEVEDNERLEFLGDAVLDLAVSHRLMARFPAAREGELSKIRAALVDEAALAALARQLDLGPLLRLGRGEELTGGRDKASILADALEAVVAVMFQGGGLDPVLALLDRLQAAALERAEAGTLNRDYKTQLQEAAQARLKATPRYRVVAEHGPDHQKSFEVELELKGEVLGRGAGRSKKDAEQAAARIGLETLLARPAEPAPAAGEVPAAGIAAEPPPPPPPAAPAPAEAKPVPARRKRAARRAAKPARAPARRKAAPRAKKRPARRRPGK